MMCPICLPHSAAVGLLPWVRRAGDIDRLLTGAQQQPRRSTVRTASKCGQCHVVSWTQTCVDELRKEPSALTVYRHSMNKTALCAGSGTRATACARCNQKPRRQTVSEITAAYSTSRTVLCSARRSYTQYLGFVWLRQREAYETFRIPSLTPKRTIRIPKGRCRLDLRRRHCNRVVAEHGLIYRFPRKYRIHVLSHCITTKYESCATSLLPIIISKFIDVLKW